MTEAEYHAQFQRRLVQLRMELEYSQETMARALGIKKDAYKKYETREKSQFPPHLYEQLAAVTHRSLEFIVTGREARQPRSRTAA